MNTREATKPEQKSLDESSRQTSITLKMNQQQCFTKPLKVATILNLLVFFESCDVNFLFFFFLNKF
jgi:hypothetical protein